MDNSHPQDPDQAPSSPDGDTETTRPLATDQTRPAPMKPAQEQPDTAAEPGHGFGTASEHSGAAGPVGTSEPAGPGQRSEPERPTGVSWPTVVLGAVALAVGLLILLVQMAGLAVDWSVVAPATVVGAGMLLVVLGLIGLLTRQRGAS
jgi:hypothetical protein